MNKRNKNGKKKHVNKRYRSGVRIRGKSDSNYWKKILTNKNTKNLRTEGKSSSEKK